MCACDQLLTSIFHQSVPESGLSQHPMFSPYALHSMRISVSMVRLVSCTARRLQVLRLQELAIVGIILQRETRVAAQSKVLYASDFFLILSQLKSQRGNEILMAHILGIHYSCSHTNETAKTHKAVC